MKDTLKDAISNLFSFGSLMIIGCSALLYFALIGVDKSQERTKACYLAGMVKVSTDAGSFCTAPTNLVEIK